ncbi:PIG-L family deacetylase [Flaviaesturariibacter amylovorans]|uniref:PIG-L family deacetylase n=1 Tax=Flaviaesturariibacter amylovorans TaxID=1084520 RepID=A0ABP8H4C2_9BACT
MRWLLILLPLFLFTSFGGLVKPRTILAVFAHPDDEGAIAPLLRKYSREGKVHLIIATDGRLGTKPGFPTGDTLVRLRESETECACRLLGVQPPVFLRYPDGFDTRIGVGNYFGKSKELRAKLTEKIREIDPDLILTFGPDGDTGHSDHRMISNLCTEIILKEGWVKRYPLYYLGWTRRDDDKFNGLLGLNTVDTNYLNVTIRYSDRDEQEALRAVHCYKSQLSQEEMALWIKVEQGDPANLFRFRQLTVPSARKEEF